MHGLPAKHGLPVTCGALMEEGAGWECPDWLTESSYKQCGRQEGKPLASGCHYPSAIFFATLNWEGF